MACHLPIVVGAVATVETDGSFKLYVCFAKEPYERDYIEGRLVSLSPMGWLRLVSSLKL